MRQPLSATSSAKMRILAGQLLPCMQSHFSLNRLGSGHLGPISNSLLAGAAAISNDISWLPGLIPR